MAEEEAGTEEKTGTEEEQEEAGTQRGGRNGGTSRNEMTKDREGNYEEMEPPKDF